MNNNPSNSTNPISSYLEGRSLPRFVNSRLINESHSSKHSILPHKHIDYMELYFITAGNNRYMVNNRFYNLKAGDIVICNEGVLHGESPQDVKQYRSYSVAMNHVHFRGLPENYLCDNDESPVISTGYLHDKIAGIFELIYILSIDTKHTSEVLDSLTQALLLLVREMIASRRRAVRIPTASYSFALEVHKYIDRHFREKLTLGQMGDAIGASEFYIGHVFKDEYGLSPMQYVMERKIGEAQQLLMETDTPIGEIAEMLGFGSVSHFITMFSKYIGLTPGKFRKSIAEMSSKE
ncbi:MAG: AraC family transcriptional regulator [Bilifractor sp.]